MALLRRLATATAISTLALVAIGGAVRATGSGDACPDWPRCLGSFVPPLEFHTLIEYSHRLAAAITGLLIIVTAWVAWRRERRDPAVLWPIVAAVAVVLVQAGIGRLRIVGGARAAIVTLHFLVAMGLVALVMMTAAATRLRRPDPGEGDPTVDRGFRRLAWWTLAATLLLLAVGAYVRGEGAGLVFLDWPLMDGRLVPTLETNGTVAAFAHRLVAAIVVVMGGVLAWRARRVAHRGVRALAWIAFGLLVVQAGLGAAAVLTELSAPAVAGHVAGSSLAWAALVATVAAASRVRVRTDGTLAQRPRTKERVAAYLQLAKPDIIVLLLITTVPAMVLAAEGMPRLSLILATLLGGTLAAAGANAVNCYLDRDIDEVMTRTRGRPLPSHRVEPGDALRFGWIAIAVAFVWLAATVNFLAATLTASAALFYVFVYTAWMKRTTPQNIVIGGAAGAVPALVGWAAVTGTVALPALVLFVVVFLWTPPHFWALAIRHAGDYRSAGVPMLPAVMGRRATALRIGVYTVLVVATSFALVPAAGLGPLYVGSAAALGALFLAHAVRVWRDPSTKAAMGLFRFSITYLALLFVAAAADQLVRG